MNNKKVMCFGTFDILHPGHLNYFQQAKKYGDYLIVVIARDKTKKLQNRQTIFNEKERVQIIQNLKLVDEAVLGSLNNKLKVINDKKPDILCLGYDQEINKDKLKQGLAKSNLFPIIKRLKPYKEHKYKSSLLKKF
jgi:FAD synthetase